MFLWRILLVKGRILGISLTTNFDENAALPLDSRFSFATTAARDLLAAGRRYEGMLVYCVDVASFFYLAPDLVTWSSFGGSADNFSYDEVVSALTIPIRQEMLCLQSIELQENITILGKLCLID